MRRWFLALAILPAVFAACGDDGDDDTMTLSAANDFAYWLQEIDLGALGASAFDAAIIDYSSDGGDEGRWTAAHIDDLKYSAGGGKVALAYISVGEAEDYRFYWQPGWSPGNPPWLGPENPEWPGNYEVRFWQTGWKTLVYQYLDRILAQGFDGVYLDKVDAYEYWESERPSARADMAAFVGEIGSYCRARKSDFLIVPQNGHELIDEAGYAARIDALGSEDNWFDGDTALPAEERQYREEYLDKYRAADKLVFAVDYCRAAGNIDYVYSRARSKRYIPYCTVRDLNRLIVNPGHAPD